MFIVSFFSKNNFVNFKKTALVALGTSALLGLSACSSFNSATEKVAKSLTFYKPDVVQGNVITSEQVNSIHIGMHKLEVKSILGTPLVESVFHKNRWDYVFTLESQKSPPQRYKLTLYFSNDTLEKFDGDEMPSEAEFVDRISSKDKVKVPQLEASQEQIDAFKKANIQTNETSSAELIQIPQAPITQPNKTFPVLEK